MNSIETYNSDLIDSILPSLAEQEKINFRMKMATKIYHGMKAKGWNQTKFASEMNKRVSVVSRWLHGSHNFESDTLYDIQKKLGINLFDVENNIDSELTVSGNSSNLVWNVFLFSDYSTFVSNGEIQQTLNGESGGQISITHVSVMENN